MGKWQLPVVECALIILYIAKAMYRSRFFLSPIDWSIRARSLRRKVLSVIEQYRLISGIGVLRGTVYRLISVLHLVSITADFSDLLHPMHLRNTLRSQNVSVKMMKVHGRVCLTRTLLRKVEVPDCRLSQTLVHMGCVGLSFGNAIHFENNVYIRN